MSALESSIIHTLRQISDVASVKATTSTQLNRGHCTGRNRVTKEWQYHHEKAPQGGQSIPPSLTARQRRIIYRCKQRGWLELDILLGSWAVKHVPEMKDGDSLTQIESLLNAETPHVFKWVLKHEDVPSQFDTPVLKNVQAYVLGEVADSSAPISNY